MKRHWVVAFAVVLLALLSFVDYQGYRALQSMSARIASLEKQVNEATRLAYQESAAANAASQRADEAATHVTLPVRVSRPNSSKSKPSARSNKLLKAAMTR